MSFAFFRCIPMVFPMLFFSYAIHNSYDFPICILMFPIILPFYDYVFRS